MIEFSQYSTADTSRVVYGESEVSATVFQKDYIDIYSEGYDRNEKKDYSLLYCNITCVNCIM